MNNPRVNEYVGNCGGSGYPHVDHVLSDNVVVVKINGVGEWKTTVQRDPLLGKLHSVRLVD